MSSDRTNNATAFRVTFPHRTNPLFEFVEIFPVAPILDAELCRSITVMPLSEAVQSSQPKTSDWLELLKINNTVLLALPSNLATLQFPCLDRSLFALPPHHPQLTQQIPQHCPGRTNTPAVRELWVLSLQHMLSHSL